MSDPARESVSTTAGSPTLRLENATLEDGSVADVTIVGERIAAIEPSRGEAEAQATDGGETPSSIDLTDHLLLAAPAEPHAHLDKALTVDRVPNPGGDLGGAIEAWLAYRPSITTADFVDRATEAARISLANGCTALRTHVDLGLDIGTRGVEALLEVKENLGSVMDIQLVGLVAGLTGDDGGEYLAIMRDALALGLDVVGGVPHIEQDPARAIELTLELAGEYGRPVDLHADENLDPTSADLETMAARVLSGGFAQPVVASHCVALGMKSEAEQYRIAELVCDAGVSVVALPQTNLYLQARGMSTAMPRGLTAIDALHRFGATVAGGGDNLRDPFCPVGRGDPLETASLLVMAGHLSPDAAYGSVSNEARIAMGLEPVRLAAGAVGSPAELMAIRAKTVGQAVAAGPPDRVVIHRGRVVSRPT